MANQYQAATSSTFSVGSQIPPAAFVFPVTDEIPAAQEAAVQVQPANPAPTPLGSLQTDEHWTAVTMYVAGMYMPDEG